MADQASGRLAKTLTSGDVSAQLVATIPECDYASVTVIVVNNTAEEATISLYIGDNEEEAAAIDLVDGEVVIPAKGRYVYACAVVSQGEHLFVKTDTADLPVRVEGVLSI